MCIDNRLHVQHSRLLAQNIYAPSMKLLFSEYEMKIIKNSAANPKKLSDKVMFG